MCIALPQRIVAIADRVEARVVLGEKGETASAMLIADGDADLDALLGRWAVAHAGFLVAVLDEADARSRLSVFAAMDGDPTEIDLSDLHAVRADESVPTTARLAESP